MTLHRRTSVHHVRYAIAVTWLLCLLQYAFMSYALGGPEKYRGKDMVTAHKHLKITEEHFNAVAGHFVATLQELNVPADIISEAAAVVVAAKPQVVNTPAA